MPKTGTFTHQFKQAGSRSSRRHAQGSKEPSILKMRRDSIVKDSIVKREIEVLFSNCD